MNATSQQMAARRYRIERYLTEGGMGAIYVGKKLGPGGFEKDVVLKQLLPEHTSRPEFRDLFFREAKISATLDHANIVHTFDLVESDESLFIVMEYVRGADLRTICRRAKLRRRQITPAAAIQIALEILAGLSYAHTRRDPNGISLDIIHRDVSPSNILCSAQGEVKLSDFGIAKASTHSSVFYRVRGKVGYMSPEQARNQPIDARTDLYSVAVCLYEALTGERLFVGDLSTPPDVIYGQPIAPTSYKRPGLPRALDHVMATALAADPDDRYQDARAFSEALRQVAHHHGMISSAPQLAEDLRDILGQDPNRWLQEELDAYGAPETQKIQSRGLEGKEASSIGVVEGSGLYRENGDNPGADLAADVIGSKSPTVTGRRVDDSDDLDLDALLSLSPKRTPAARPAPKPAASRPTPGNDHSPLAIPIDDDQDEDVPTSRSQPVTATPRPPGAPPPAPPPARMAAPPPPPRVGPPPVPPRNGPPPPPPSLNRPPAAALESPFEEEEDLSEVEDFPFTPAATVPAPPTTGSPPRGTPYATAPYGQAQLPPPVGRDGQPLSPAVREPHLPPPPSGREPPQPAHTHEPPMPAPPPAPKAHAGHTAHGPQLPGPHGGFAPPPMGGVPRPIPTGGTHFPFRPMASRSSPPWVVVAIVLLAAMVGGAKLAAEATRGDRAALLRGPEVEAAATPGPAAPAPP
jgi:serine/threonine protein kinase